MSVKDQHESWLDDVQLLRNRGLGLRKIAEHLGKDERQISRWVVELKAQRRWRTLIHEYRPDEIGRMYGSDGRWI